MSFGLVLIGSKLITNRVFEGFVLAEDLLGLPGLLPPRSCCKIKINQANTLSTAKLYYQLAGNRSSQIPRIATKLHTFITFIP
jgi:hypothetical protein